MTVTVVTFTPLGLQSFVKLTYQAKLQLQSVPCWLSFGYHLSVALVLVSL